MGSRTKYLIAGGASGFAIIVFVVWFVVFRDTAPEAVSLEGAVAAVTSTTAPAADTPTTSTSFDGTWTIDTSVGGGDVDAGTFVGYRVQEELARIGANTAVGRTGAVSGSIEFSGSAVTAVTVEADLSQLRSDSSQRDRQMRRQALETGTFPTATFVLTDAVDLGTIPTEGTPFSVEASGDLTVHGVTRNVTVPIEGQLIGDSVVVVGGIAVVFADYDIDPPSAAIVLSVADEGEMEFQLFFTKN